MNSVDNLKIEEKGFIDIDVDESLDLIQEIGRMRKEKRVVILAHFYQEGEVQDIADFVGDSLGLSQQAAATDADIILFAGVHFMAETAKILAPDKRVLLPDLQAGCSLADSCPPADFAAFKAKHPGHTVISYVNTTAGIKALTDIVCTSTNALEIVKSLPEEEKIIFAPDRNLGNYIRSVTERDMVIWDGACHVHEEFSLERILELKKVHPDAQIIAHPECEKQVLIVADHIGSTTSLLKYTMHDKGKKYIVATESGILHQMRKERPEKLFIPAPPKDSTCACNDCKYMKLITLKKIYNTLKYELPEITLEKELMDRARKSVVRMLEISEKLKL
ncbi:MAG: quinolinate synthase NadA [Bacteroidota bacterium]